MDFPEVDVEELSDLPRQYGSSSAAESKVDFTSVREAQTDGSVHENSVAAGGLHVDSNQFGRKGSSSLPDDFENLKAPYDKSQVLANEFVHDQERIQPALKDEGCKGEMDELSGSYFHKSSFHFMEKTSHSKSGTEDSAHSQESPIIDESQREKMQVRSNLDGKTIPDEVEVNIFRKSSYRQESGPNKDNYDSKNSPTESGRMDAHHSHPHSLEASPSKVRQISVSPDRSPDIFHSSHGRRPLSSQEHIEEPYDTSTRHRHSSSHERSSRHGHRKTSLPKRSDQEVPSSFRKQTSNSPEKRQSASPKSHNSSRKYRRRERSVSQSPVKQRASSSGYKREHSRRSRSRSPHKRGHHRSSRGRYSPRQSSPRHYSSRHSPQHRPWVPPPNRKTGLGKPGNNLFVAGFSFLTTERDLERKFSRFGCVRDVRIVRDKRSGDSRGFGFLSLERDEDADAAIRALDETEWNGRIILVEKSKSH